MKRIYKWLIYYAVAIFVTSTVAYLLGARFYVSFASLLPLAVTAAMLYQALLGRNYENWKASLLSITFSKRNGDRSFHRRPSSDYDTTTDRIDEFVFRIVLPYAVPFGITWVMERFGRPCDEECEAPVEAAQAEEAVMEEPTPVTESI